MSFYETKKTNNYTVESLGEIEDFVYDIEVDDTHNFYGNNILIHNSIWFDKDAMNLAKASLDSYAERTVSWFTRATFNVSVLDDEERQAYYDELDAEISDPESRMKYPSEFPFEGRVIFISNLPYEKFDSAVLTRSMKIDMSLTEQEMFIRMESILQHLGDPNIPISAKREIFDFLKTANKTGKMSGISMRTYVSAEEFYKSGLPNWKDLLAFG